jgi:uncharacterized protein (DUF58 family)
VTPREILKKVRQIEIRTRRLVEETLAGSYHSTFRGRGVEFSEVRGYQPGDDVRSIDWNVTARMGEPFIKKFTEERELTVMLVVDASASTKFGTSTATKAGVIAEISALLAFSAIRNDDRVGLLQFTDRVENFVPPRKGRKHVLRVLRDILAFEPAGNGTDLDVALEAFAHAVRKRAVVFLVSDFQVGSFGAHFRALARRHDMVALSVDDPRETVLPHVGLISAEDPETGTVRWIDAGDARVRGAFAEASARRHEQIRATCRSAGVDLLELSTAEHYEKQLLTFFRRRASRSRRAV